MDAYFTHNALMSIKRAGDFLKNNFGEQQRLRTNGSSERADLISRFDQSCNKMLIDSLVPHVLSCFGIERLLLLSEEMKVPLLVEKSGNNLSMCVPCGQQPTFALAIDPLCGSIPYARGIPDYCVSVCLMKGGQPYWSCVYAPSSAEMFTAYRNEGAYLNGKHISPSTTSNIADAYISIEHKVWREYPITILRDLACEMRRLRVAGTCGLEMCYVACGKLDAIIKLRQPVYDFAAGYHILRESAERPMFFPECGEFESFSLPYEMKTRVSFVAGNSTLVRSIQEHFSEEAYRNNVK